MPRTIVTPEEISKKVALPTSYGFERVKKLYGNLALPSYVHGYSLAIEYMYNWFKSKFDKDFFRGGIYIDGKNIAQSKNFKSELNRTNPNLNIR